VKDFLIVSHVASVAHEESGYRESVLPQQRGHWRFVVDQPHDLEDFLILSNVPNVEYCGGERHWEGRHQAAKMFFTNISNWSRP